MDENKVVISNLSKSFFVSEKEPGLLGSMKGLFYRKKIEKKALDSISLTLNKGEILGLIGANGAGKTTLIKILSGIIYPTSGEVSIYGDHPWNRSNWLKRKMALIMGQKAQLWWDLPAMDSFLLLKEIYQIPQKQYHDSIQFLADTLDIKDQLKIQVRKLSLGERMKVELMAALLHRPEIIFLDEPTIGLDLMAQKAIRKFIKNYQEEFRPITILTSHYMQDIVELCPRIAIIRAGKIIYDGPIQNIQKKPEKKVIRIKSSSMPGNIKSHFKPMEVEYVSETEIIIPVFKEELNSTIALILQHLIPDDISIEEPDIDLVIEGMLKG